MLKTWNIEHGCVGDPMSPTMIFLFFFIFLFLICYIFFNVFFFIFFVLLFFIFLISSKLKNNEIMK